MARFAAAITIDAPPERVWELLADWEGSSEWMVDNTTVEILGSQREGSGTRVRAVTRIAGIPLTDTMVVTAWDPPRMLEVLHTGWPIRGAAWFALTPADGGTRFEWVEDLRPPMGALGELGACILRTPLERVLQKSLTKFKAVAERGN